MVRSYFVNNLIIRICFLDSFMKVRRSSAIGTDNNTGIEGGIIVA